MTVSSSSTYELTLNGVVELAYIQSGLLEQSQTPTTAQYNHALKVLDSMVLKHLETRGAIARHDTLVNVTLTANDYTYTLSSSVSMVHGDARYIPADESVTAPSTESTIVQIGLAQWQELTPRDDTDTPTQFYINRAVHPLELWLWPTPDEAGTVRLTVSKLLANATLGTDTADLDRHWQLYLVYELAFHLAPLGFKGRGDLKAVAEQAFRECLGTAAPRGARYMKNVHRTGWERC